MKKIFSHDKALKGHCRSCGEEFDSIQNFCPKCSSGDVFNPPDSYKELEKQSANSEKSWMGVNVLVLKKRLNIWCIGSLVYFLCIYAASFHYYRTTGDAPILLVALHHDWIFTTILSAFLPQGPSDEVVAFIGGIIFYAGLGALLGLLQYRGHKYVGSRGTFFAILSSMIGYSIGAAVGGHPPMLILLNPPIFFVVGYFWGKITFKDSQEGA